LDSSGWIFPWIQHFFSVLRILMQFLWLLFLATAIYSSSPSFELKTSWFKLTKHWPIKMMTFLDKFSLVILLCLLSLSFGCLRNSECQQGKYCTGDPIKQISGTCVTKHENFCQVDHHCTDIGVNYFSACEKTGGEFFLFLTKK
jgi:hypothetical protein